MAGADFDCDGRGDNIPNLIITFGPLESSKDGSVFKYAMEREKVTRR